jgi:hypothetical protein
MFTPVQEPDGNLVLEMYFAETAFLDSILQNSIDPYTCLVGQNPGVTMECLDVAGPSTLGGALDSKEVISARDGLPQAVFYSYSSTPWETTDVTLFGNERRCSDGKRIGDGVLDSFDLYSFMAWHFSVPPYNTLSTIAEEVHTVQGETALADRCNDGVSRNAYLSAFRPNDPCFRPSARRRLQDGGGGITPSNASSTDLNATVWTHKRFLDLDVPGTWFHIRLPRLAISVQLVLEGSGNEGLLTLSSDPAPLDWNLGIDPVDPNKHELRFARHLEYYDYDVGVDGRDCASIGSPLVGGASMYYETISVGQVVDASRQFMCTFDLFLYKPNCGEGCELYVSTASRAIDGLDGLVQERTSQCFNTPFDMDLPSPSPFPPPLPPTPPLMPTGEYVNEVSATINLRGDASNFKEGEAEFELFRGAIALEAEVAVDDVIVVVIGSGDAESDRRMLQSISELFSVNVTVRTRTEKSTELAVEFFDLPTQTMTEVFVENFEILQNVSDPGSGDPGVGSGEGGIVIWKFTVDEVYNKDVDMNVQYANPAPPPIPPLAPSPNSPSSGTSSTALIVSLVSGAFIVVLITIVAFSFARQPEKTKFSKIPDVTINRATFIVTDASCLSKHSEWAWNIE